MAATSTITKEAVSLKLENGTTTTGATKTVSVSMGTMNKDTIDVGKIYAIASLIMPCLSKTIYAIEQVTTSTINNG